MWMCLTVGGTWRTCGEHANPTKTLSEPAVIPRTSLQYKNWRNRIGKDGGPESGRCFFSDAHATKSFQQVPLLKEASDHVLCPLTPKEQLTAL